MTDERDQQSKLAENQKLVEVPDTHCEDSNDATKSIVGTVIDGHYEVLELIGSGGMGTVYRGHHLELNKSVAIKLLEEPKVTEQLARRFDREAKAASTLRHSGIASVTNYGMTDGGQPYLVMDFVAGETLHKVLEKKSRLSQSEALQIFIGIAEALQYAHDKGVLHRDIKPSNIILEQHQNSYRPTVIDFGIARIVHEDSETPQNITKTGEIFGSPLYMSPEQGMGYKVDRRSDIYSLGCVMYECLTGRVPFEGDNAVQTIFKHLNEKPLKFKDVSRELANLGAIEQIISKCLEKKADERYQTMENLLSDLRLLQQGKAPEVETTSALTKWRRLKLAFAAGLAGVIIIGSASLFAIQGSPTAEFRRLGDEAIAQWRMGPDHYAEADATFKKARLLLKSGKVSKDIAVIYLSTMGQYYHAAGKNKEAIEAISSAIEVADLGLSKEQQAGLRKDLLARLVQSGDFDKAIKEGTAASNMYKELNLSEAAAENAYTLGTAFRMKDQHEKALESYLQAYQIAKQLHPNQDSRMQAIAAQSIAYVMADLNKPDEAMRYGLESIKIFKQTQGVSDNETQTAATWLASFAAEHGHPDTAAQIKQEFGLK